MAQEATVLAGLEEGVDALVQLTLLARDVDATLAEASACGTRDERLRHYAAAVDTAQTACAAVRAVSLRAECRPPDCRCPRRLPCCCTRPQWLPSACSTLHPHD